jgi:branched-chain amino acid transport system ATP-binding protein
MLSVVENLEMGSQFPKARKMRKETMAWVFKLFPRLEERRSQLAGTLSGGEQQMLAIGRGLMSRPALLMLDEPSLGLSPILVKAIFDIIKEINQQGTTILLVEQNVFHSLNLSHRGYVLENGSIVLSGTGQDLLKNQHIRQSYLGL